MQTFRHDKSIRRFRQLIKDFRNKFEINFHEFPKRTSRDHPSRKTALKILLSCLEINYTALRKIFK